MILIFLWSLAVFLQDRDLISASVIVQSFEAYHTPTTLRLEAGLMANTNYMCLVAYCPVQSHVRETSGENYMEWNSPTQLVKMQADTTHYTFCSLEVPTKPKHMYA